jgi:hypothetical protein
MDKELKTILAVQDKSLCKDPKYDTELRVQYKVLFKDPTGNFNESKYVADLSFLILEFSCEVRALTRNCLADLPK